MQKSLASLQENYIYIETESTIMQTVEPEDAHVTFLHKIIWQTLVIPLLRHKTEELKKVVSKSLNNTIHKSGPGTNFLES